MNPLTVMPVLNLPLIQKGDDIAALIAQALSDCGQKLRAGDVLAVTHKIVSKAEGSVVELEQVEVSGEAAKLAAETGKDPRVVQVILDESSAVVRQRWGLIIAKHKKGWICANAGVDYSNVAGEIVALLPRDPDQSAAAIRRALQDRFGLDLAVLIVDSQGRPFRRGLVGVALGCSGLPALYSRVGQADLFGYRLQGTESALADQAASAALLVMGEGKEGIPVVIIRGLTYPASPGRAAELVRPESENLFP